MVENRIKIGMGNRLMDLISLTIVSTLLFTVLVLSFFYENAIYLFLIMLVANLFEFWRVWQRNYIFFVESHFVIVGIFGERARINAAYFKDVEKPPFGTSVMFSNELILSFKNGLEFRFLGGGTDWLDVREFVRGLASKSTSVS